MKKISAFITLLVIIGSALWWWGQETHITQPFEEKAKASFKKPLRTIKQSLNEKLTHRAATIAVDSLSQCDPLFEKLTHLTYQEMNDNFKLLHEELSKDCKTSLEKNLHQGLLVMFKGCEPGKHWDVKSCEQFYSLMRARAISLKLDKNIPLSQWTESELMNTILWQFVQEPHPSESNLASNLKLIDELLTRVPDLYAASKAKFINLLLQELIYKNTSGSKELEKTWRELMEYGAEESLKYFPILKPMMRGDMSAYSAQVKKWQQTNPTDPMGYYYGAYASWKSKDRAGTIKALEKALSLAPDNEQIKNSLKSARAGRFGDPIFTLNFGFSFDDI